MMKGKPMTIDQVRTALDHMETNYGLAMDAGDYGLANAFHSKIDWLWSELTRLIQAEDPYTTEADIRYFEQN
jgi:hypothetical protein